MMAQVFFEGQYLPLLVGLIRSASECIDVCCYEWGWFGGQRQGTAQDINREICTASKRGVRVRVLLHNEPPGRVLGKINRKTAGMLRRYGVDVRLGGTAKTLHAKLWVFDGSKAVVGSHNMSRRALTINAEAGVLVDEPREVEKVRAYFERLWGGVPVPALDRAQV